MLWNITQVWVNTYYFLKKWLPEDKTYILVSGEGVEITQAKAGRKRKEKEFPGTKTSIYKGLKTGKKKKKQKCRKVQEVWLTVSEGGEWVVMELESQSPVALRRLLNLGLAWEGFKQGDDMIRQSLCKDHLGVSVDKMRVFDRRQTPA